MRGFGECFADLPDPRAENALHDLTEILFIALLATLCGATSCTDMALFARMKAYLWQDVLVLKNGLPSHDTFSRVFRMLDPKAFETSFRRFMKAFAAGAKIKRPRGVIALDGKALRRTLSHVPCLTGRCLMRHPRASRRLPPSPAEKAPFHGHLRNHVTFFAQPRAELAYTRSVIDRRTVIHTPTRQHAREWLPVFLDSESVAMIVESYTTVSHVPWRLH